MRGPADESSAFDVDPADLVFARARETELAVGRAQGRFVCEIVDRGDGFDDPAAGYLAPRKGIGVGLWVARQLTWRIEFFYSPGFTTRIWL